MTNELDLEVVRARAKELGVTYHPAQKAETILANIERHIVEQASGVKLPETPPAVDATPKSKAQQDAAELEALRKKALALIPITITSMDPADASLTAVVISVGNRKLGQITKAIPFGYKWYMPEILVKAIERQMFCRSSMIPTPNGQERINTQWIKKYAAANRHVHLDYFSSMTDATGMLREELSEDDLHPNAAGYAIMAPLAVAAIEKTTK